MPARSRLVTRWFRVLGNFGSRVSAKSIFRVDAGASGQCALCAASTWPFSASATIQDRADSSLGSTGAPAPSRTCVPGLPSSSPPTVDMTAGGLGCVSWTAFPTFSSFPSAWAGGAARVSGRNTAAATAQAVFFEADTVVNVQVRNRDPNPGRPFEPTCPPGRGHRGADGDTGAMKLGRRVSWFLLAFGVWNWFIWITFSI